jgi:hypothetical protein
VRNHDVVGDVRRVPAEQRAGYNPCSAVANAEENEQSHGDEHRARADYSLLRLTWERVGLTSFLQNRSSL